ncbi:hypothetical protein UFOVP530_16 [uncultured Caudovirales phage]|uniref:Uncharacterized protein n=1 Tax=uncultured Caudovirales phage TaxID=2100421 RepID=A0A6J5R1C7_9CAUD|nr:hypothetical protein UFOVP530_16 [uncultured Caudovirales phage]CAB4178890.1 hypothetical protein UFOVP1027_16 [uncultured Caudovirales phage]CAB4188456.1 hypothetical protein UFOVP1182_34 [uncultured Caudovirales phage]CAB4220661.1 hypothetical protein UFOVP1632_50 [uncultured Caudovirales phage]
MASQWRIYDNDIKYFLNNSNETNNTKIAKLVLEKNNITINAFNAEELSRYVLRNRNKIQLQEHNQGVINACENLGVDPSTTPMLWLKSKNESIRVTNPLFVKQDEVLLSTLRDNLIQDLQDYIPKFPKLERIVNSDSYLLVIDPADIHIGKLCSAFESGESYNNQIAVQRVLSGVRGILNKVSSFHIDKILFIGGNDILHIDNPQRTTTSGTPQDTDGMWHSNFLIAKQLYVDVLELLLTVADVHFTFNPSNHDYTNGFFLAQVIETYFKSCENITFDCSIAHRKAFQYHNNLIGTTHGDGAKQIDLPLLMAVEYPSEWSKTKHRYIYTHHVHHKTSKDYIGITVESLRSPSGTDSWHHRNGYQHAPKAVEAFLHCKDNGQIARITHIF